MVVFCFHAEFVVAASKVLDERVTPHHDRSCPVGSQPSHRSQPGLEPSVIILYPVVGVLLGVMNRVRDKLVDHAKQRCCQIGGDLGGSTVNRQRTIEERSGGTEVAPFRHIYVDDLAMLINSAVHVPPHTGDLHIRFVDEPAVPDAVPAGSCSIDE